MDMRNEGDAVISGKKKHKKRKSVEISDLGREEHNVQEADDGHRKRKMETGVVDDAPKSISKRSRKEKKTKDISGVGGSPERRGDSDVGMSRKGKIHVEEDDAKVASNVELAKGREEHDREEGHVKKKKSESKGKKKKPSDDSLLENQTYDEVIGEAQPEKKKKKSESKVKKKMPNDDSLVENQTYHEGTEEAQPEKKTKKKQKNVEENLEDVFVSNEVLEVHEVGNGEDSRLRGDNSTQQVKKNKSEKCKEVVENAQPVKDKKREKKGDVGAGDSGKNRDGGSIKRKEKSFGCNTEEDINGDGLENSKKNETAEPTDNSNHNKKVKDKKTKKKGDVGGGDSGRNRDRGSKKRKDKSLGCNTEEDIDAGVLENSKKNETAEPTDNSNRKKKSKKVKFSDNVEVFPITDTSSKGKKKKLDEGCKEKNEDGVIHGKRFSKEDDEIIQDAVYKYIEDHRLGERGLEMVLNCKSHSEVRHCWKEIGEALPWRHYKAVYCRAHVLFERSESRKWTPEEIELLKKFYEKHGPDWRTLGNELGKHRFHVKDTWRRNRYPNLKKGRWTQEEYQNLFNLVNLDLSMKVFEEKKTKHGMLRDNICWEAVSEKLSTRTNSWCCTKWYDQLTSPMVSEGEWLNADDYRLLMVLVDLDAACEEDVDWDYLLEHRSGDVCRKRWNEMVRHIGENGIKPFSEQVEILSQRYCPDILEAREIYDNKVPVDL